MGTKSYIILFLYVFVICVFAGSDARADTVIPYELNSGWTYEADYEETLELTENPSGGIIVSINIPTGIDDGGLTASRHDLPGYSLHDHGFIQLEYNSLSSERTGNPGGPDLCLELEFNDADDVMYGMAIAVSQDNEGFYFETWFESIISDSYYETPVPDGLSVAEGALGLYSDGSLVLPYFIDATGSVSYPFEAWDVSGITGAHDYRVDNDFEGNTMDSGTITASVNLEQVVYGPGTPAPEYPISDHVFKIIMSSTYNYDYPGVTLHYEFEVSIQADATVIGGNMYAPDGTEYPMFYSSDGVESWLDVYFNGPDPSVWDGFGAGTYTFTVNYEDGSSDSTSVDYQLPNGDPIPYVTQEPQFIYPEHDAIDVPLQCTLQFDPANDPIHTIDIWIEPEDDISGALEYNIMVIPYDTSSYGPVSLSPSTLYECGYTINHFFSFNNEDGIPTEMDTDSGTQIHFTTTSLVDDDLDIERIGIMTECEYVDGIPDGLYPWDFEIDVFVSDPGSLHHINVTNPIGASVESETIYQTEPGSWEFDPPKDSSLDDLRAKYPEGTYIFEFYDSENSLLKTISLDYNGLSAPASPVDFTYPPSNDETGVSTDPTFAWNIAPDAGDILAPGIDDEAIGDHVYGALVPMTTLSWSPESLEPDHDYHLDVTVSRIKDWAGPDNLPTMVVEDDEFIYYLTFDYINTIYFTTGSPFEPIDEIEEVLDFVDESVDAGTLTGEGPGNSADNRLNALRNKLEEAQSLIEAELYEEACDQLWSIYRKCDGDSHPPDFVTGEAADELADMILLMMDELGC